MSHKIRNLLSCTGLFLALGLVTSQAVAALSISQTPLFLTISLPPNITVLLDDSGSLQWAHAPDSMGANGNAVVNVSNGSPNATSTLTNQVAPTVTHKFGKYFYSCTSPYVKDSGWTFDSGSSSTPPAGDICDLFSTTYTCPTGDTVSGSGSSMTCTGYQYASVYIPDTNEYKSSAFNPLAYNPQVAYVAPYTASGSQYTTSFTAAWVNGYDTALGSINLSTNYEATVDYNPSHSASTLSGSTSHCAQSCVRDEDNSCNGIFSGSSSPVTCGSIHNPGAAFYYTFTPTSATAVANNCGQHAIPGTSNPVQYAAQVDDDSCYTRITVSSTSGPGGTDERQNFANWYSFYRTRNLTVASGADVAFNSISQTYRVAWLNLHTCPDFSGTNCKGWDSTQSSVDNRIGTFTGQHRTDFFNWLSRFPANNGTNLRQQLDKVGVYYTTSGEDSPYAFNPHVTDSPEYVCRPNYAAVMTDGLWNESTSNLTEQPGNADSTAVTLPDNVPYNTGTHPYTDGNTNTLSDVAFHYWATNLRPDLGTSTALEYQQFSKTESIKDDNGTVVNLAPYWNPENDPASWPHMVTFTIGLGLSTSLASPPTWGGSTFVKGYNDLVTGLDSWPSSFSCGDASGSCTDPIGNVYDLWHAAIDSRGEFFAADNPQAVVAAFNSIITRIQGRVGSSSSVAVNSTRLNSNTLVYQAQFNSSDWSGEVAAYSLDTTNGSVNTTTPVWKASTGIPAATSRNILTIAGGAGVAFQWANLSSNEQAYLNKNLFGVADGNGSLRVSYLRGDQTNEQSNGGIFRTRNVLLGDVVDSNPFYVGSQDFGYSTNTTALPEGASYESFVTTKAGYTPMLYFGANDGMLHAVNANTGAEVFTYVPHGVYPNLSALTDPTYVHQFYVDGSPNEVDAYYGSTPAWHSVLVGTAGAGAREVYALDVTNAASESATNLIFDYDGATAATGGTSDNSMGYTLGVATVARMHDGNWYVIWANGYNSPNQTAVLYLYNLSTGAITTFDTKAGSSTSPNGMSTPAPIDFDGDRITDAIYAGDLLGNMWKLDVSSSNPSQWGWAFGTKSSPLPLFTADDANGNVQPITDRPQVGKNKNGQVMVYFGTGTYFLTSDNTVPSNPPVQSFYGIIDAGAQVLGVSKTVSGKTFKDRSELLQQFIVAESTGTNSSTIFRVTTSYSMTSSDQGWFMDLETPSTTTPTTYTAEGERSVSDSVLDGGRIVFTTVIPQGNACEFGGTSWLMELDANSGAQLTTSPFDVNGDGKMNNSDTLTVTYTDPATNKQVTVAAPVSGQESTVGIIKTPAIIDAGNKQYKYFSGSTGKFQDVAESNPNSGGRLSWQQLQ